MCTQLKLVALLKLLSSLFCVCFNQGKQRELQHEQPQHPYVVHEWKQDDDGQLWRWQNPRRNPGSHVVEPRAAAHFRLRPPAFTWPGCSAGAQRSTSAGRSDCTKRGFTAPPPPPPPPSRFAWHHTEPYGLQPGRSGLLKHNKLDAGRLPTAGLWSKKHRQERYWTVGVSFGCFGWPTLKANKRVLDEVFF